MHDGMPYDPIQGQVTRPLKLEILRFSKSISSAIFNVSWQMTTDSETTEQYLTFVQSRFLISVLVIGNLLWIKIISYSRRRRHASRTQFTVATVILQNKPRFVREKPRNPDETKKTQI